MSRTFDEHHPVAHNPKNRFPSPYLDNEGKKTYMEKLLDMRTMSARNVLNIRTMLSS